MPSLPPSDFIQFSKPKRNIKAKKFADCETTNILDKHVRNNSKSLKIPDNKTVQYRNSFFVSTIIHWNHLPEETVQTTSIEAFKKSLEEQRI